MNYHTIIVDNDQAVNAISAEIAQGAFLESCHVFATQTVLTFGK